MTPKEKTKVIEKMVLEGSVEQQQLMDYASNKLEIDLKTHVDRLKKVRPKASSQIVEDEEALIQKLMEITKQYEADPKPFDLPSVQYMRSTFQNKLPLKQMKNLKDPAHDKDAQGQVHNVIEIALDKYSRRCGFINKKLEM